ncbi:MAG: DUF72 domain-containing protein [Nitrospirae bacterium]|nr:DUF72 domain-containing protein [Nitrospirota bacterium]
MAKVKIGCSGFMYNHWKGVFYPEGLPKKKWFQYYTGVFDTVELNVTFYRLPKQESFAGWYKKSPEGFSFSIKGSRYITHVKRLEGPEEALERFFNVALNLKDKLSVVLWQFPPGFGLDYRRLEKFLYLLRNYRVRHAFEFRHPDWIVPEVTGLLKEEGHAFCMADWPGFINELPVTAEFVYIRRHGHGGRYDSCYSASELRKDASRIDGYLKRGLDVYMYFNNDAFGYAPKNAVELKELLGRK